MYGARSIQAPEPQKAPVLSDEKESATSGALPPRIAATILSSFTPADAVDVDVRVQLLEGLDQLVEDADLALPGVNPLQTVTVAGSFVSNVCAVPSEPPPPPPRGDEPQRGERAVRSPDA